MVETGRARLRRFVTEREASADVTFHNEHAHDPSGYSDTDLITRGFVSTPKLATLVESTQPMFTFDKSKDLREKPRLSNPEARGEGGGRKVPLRLQLSDLVARETPDGRSPLRLSMG